MNERPNLDPSELDARLRDVNQLLDELADQQEANNAAADAITMGSIDNMSDGEFAKERAELLAKRAQLLMAKAAHKS